MLSTYRLQTGATLIICLMLLLVMTLLGISAVTTTTMEEKMAGNVRNAHMAFQAAEAALRAGELDADGLTDTSLFDGTNGLYPRSEPEDVDGTDGAVADFEVWNDADEVWADYDLNNITTFDVAQNPQYIIEDYAESPRDANCGLELPPPPGCILPLYRVTAQGWGLNTINKVIVQSTYKQL